MEKISMPPPAPKVEVPRPSPDVQPRANTWREIFNTTKEVWSRKGQEWLNKLRGKISERPKEAIEEIANAPDELLTQQTHAAIHNARSELEKIANMSSSPTEIPVIGSESGDAQEIQEKEQPKYIQETMVRVEEHSQQQLHEFLYAEDRLKESMRTSLEYWAEAQALVDVTEAPQEKAQAMSLMETALDFSLTPEARGDNRFGGLRGESDEQAMLRKKLDVIRSSYGQINKKWDSRKKELLNSATQELFAQAEKNMNDSQEEGDVVVISVSKDHLQSILTDGKYTPTLERYKLTEPKMYQQMRSEVQAKISERGIQVDPSQSTSLDAHERRMLRELDLGTYTIEKGAVHPVYGQMSVREELFSRRVQEGYGDTEITLKRNRVQGRTLFNTGDSLNESATVGQQLNWRDATKARVFLDRLMADKRVDWRQLPPYIEAQVMGEVGIQDIEKITVVKDNANTLEAITARLEGSRIEVNDINGTVTVWLGAPKPKSTELNQDNAQNWYGDPKV